MPREQIRNLAHQYLDKGQPTGCFEPLYAQSQGDASAIPWADFRANAHLISWLAQHPTNGAGQRALVIGCGLGDDAEKLAQIGFDVTAFDISPTAIDWCRRRFPDSPVNYLAADLLNPPPQWRNAFDFIFEAYTLQALPGDIRPRAIANIAPLLAQRGRLLLITRGRDDSE